ncbi:MAG: hypothetical protein KDJ54_16090 [Candidatus Competibacteraceae bacterium]|nr:hypothetical protein [Candidatus Competibacteraceae bacterium]
MKIPVAEKIGLDSVALDGHQDLETIPNKTSITFSGSLMIQVDLSIGHASWKSSVPRWGVPQGNRAMWGSFRVSGKSNDPT